ncbi:MAG: hypothetical protein CTY16_17520 [Methylobacter sp.]|nr:MAG: hypothetical protein CTY16_17520 [Methylobacter sp.]
MSLPVPPFKVSSPPSPLRRLSPLLPMRVSLKLLPVRFSKRLTVSLPAPPVFCTVLIAKLMVMAAVALR